VIERKLPVNLVRGVLAWVVGLLAIPLTAVPFVAYAHYSQEGRLIALHVDRAFRGPATARIDPADAKYFASRHLHYSNAVMVLNVHAVMDGGDLSDNANPESSVLPVRLFAADMQMLRHAGYHTVTPEQITAWREGVLDLPHNALLLTFDDGRTDTVLNAAPILRRVGMRATVFAIGDAWKKSPLYEATAEELRSLQRQGWSIEAHASAPHSGIEASGKRLPYLSALRSVDGRLETLTQFRARAATEYREARLAAEKIANRPVVAFAWPFGAYGADTRTNDGRVAEINIAEARRVYSLGFNEDGQTSFSLLTHDTDPMRIARFELVPTLTPRQLFERLELAIAASAPEVSRVG
jgi:peptidoglycan/xylan/chitin deacetylase (PgdA/CDA1 family)